MATGALSLADGTSLVIERGDAMQQAADERPGTMAALIGIADDDAESACQRAESDVWVANYNAPGQVVIAGTEEGIAAANGPRQGTRGPQDPPHPGVRGLPHPDDAARPEPGCASASTRSPSTLPKSPWWPTSTPGSTPTPASGRGCCRPSSAARCAGATHSRH